MKKIYILLITLLLFSCNRHKDLLFSDDFENGLDNWELTSPYKIKIIESNDSAHKKVLELNTNGSAAYALIKGSEKWKNFSVEADFLFPENFHHYIGFIYNFNQNAHRADFGSIFVFGPYGAPFDSLLNYYGNYLYGELPLPKNKLGNSVWANPHRDFKASRALYPDYYVLLPKDQVVGINEWHKFKAIVVDSVCQVFVDDLDTPRLTFDLFEFASGKVGFKPRYSGSACWLDNVIVKKNQELKKVETEGGLKSDYELCLNDWNFIGPFYHNVDSIILDPDMSMNLQDTINSQIYRWEPFSSDNRGCVVADRITEFKSGKNIVYFKTNIYSKSDSAVTLYFHTANNLTLWVNKQYVNYINGKRPNEFLYPDFMSNPNRSKDSLSVNLKEGNNELLIRLIGGRYSGDGFYAAMRTNN